MNDIDFGGLGEDGVEMRLEESMVNIVSQQYLEENGETNVSMCDAWAVPCKDSLVVDILAVRGSEGSVCVNMNVIDLNRIITFVVPGRMVLHPVISPVRTLIVKHNTLHFLA